MATLANTQATSQHKSLSPYQLAKRRRNLLYSASITMVALILLSLYIMPLVFGVVTSLKTKEQASAPNSPIIPSEIVQLEYEGKTYDVYKVPTDEGVQQWALYQRRRRGASIFIDINDPNKELIEWEGNTFVLEPVYELSFKWDNYPTAWDTIAFPRLLFNTMVYAIVTMIGTLIASSFVAYGFARFRFPLKGILFMVLMSTIILPPAVTLVPTYAFFIRVMDWGGTWYPLIIPQMFGNAYNIFLLRQYFLTIPREMEEAAQVDGAGPFRTFISIILPQSKPALTAVALFHFFFAWNDFFGPLIYLAGSRAKNPITVGLTEFNGLYSANTELILAASVISMVLPLAIFFLAQRVFIQGIVITGVDK